MSNSIQPFKDPFGPGQQYDIGTGYVAFEDSGDPTFLVTLKQFDAAGTFVQTVATRGNVYGLGPEGFLFVGEFGTGTLISNNEGHSYRGTVTYTPAVCSQNQCLATDPEIDVYDASDTPLAEGETASTTPYVETGQARY